ncbi:MAG: DUF1848 domain-containing protein [Lachnospiraceae bacterium]|nr:DUF1848 domain-containing protein [Lachnospiraceae bacterium]
MLISASRRTDIPSYYSDWFFRRIKEGFVLVRNPMNFHQLSRVSLSPDKVDGIVFWTKNPSPMLDRLNELRDYMYYFQFTLTPYAADIEPNLPAKNEKILSAFKRLSDTIGSDRVIWRYDPIFINEKYSPAFHTQAFGEIARELKDYAKKVIISFIDKDYRGVKDNIKELAMSDFPPTLQIKLSYQLAEIAKAEGLLIETCAEEMDLKKFGIGQASCIDEKLFEKLLGFPLDINKDKNQRPQCGCATSIDIGMYNTCLTGCRYCYANYSPGAVKANSANHNPLSPLLCGEINEADKLSDRDVKSCRRTQMTLGDFGV